MIILPDTNTPTWDEMSTHGSVITSASSKPQADHLRVGGTQINTNPVALQGIFSVRAFAGWDVFQVFRYAISTCKPMFEGF